MFLHESRLELSLGSVACLSIFDFILAHVYWSTNNYLKIYLSCANQNVMQILNILHLTGHIFYESLPRRVIYNVWMKKFAIHLKKLSKTFCRIHFSADLINCPKVLTRKLQRFHTLSHKLLIQWDKYVSSYSVMRFSFNVISNF